MRAAGRGLSPKGWALGVVAAYVLFRVLCPAFVCTPDANPQAVIELEGRQTPVEPAGRLLWLDVDGSKLEFEFIVGDFNPPIAGELEANDTFVVGSHQSGSSGRLDRNAWGEPDGIELTAPACRLRECPTGWGRPPVVGTGHFQYRLSCSRRPGWPMAGASILEVVRKLPVLLVELSPFVALPLLLLLALAMTWVELRVAARFARPSLVSALGLVARVAATFALFATDYARDPFFIARPLDSVQLLMIAGCSGLQLLVAAVLSYRRRDVPDGHLRHAASLRSVLLVESACAAAVVLCAARNGTDSYGAGELHPLWLFELQVLFFTATPILLWRLLPARWRSRIRQAGVALVVFTYAQALIGLDPARKYLSIFLGPPMWGSSDAAAVASHRTTLELLTTVVVTLAFAAFALASPPRRVED